MPADWCPACGPHFIGRCPHVPYPLDGPLLGDPLPLTEEQILRLRAILAAEDGACAWCAQVEGLRADIAEARLRLAMHTGDKAVLPADWEWLGGALRRRGPAGSGLTAYVYPEGEWEGVGELCYKAGRVCPTATEALAEASAWLAERGAP